MLDGGVGGLLGAATVLGDQGIGGDGGWTERADLGRPGSRMDT